MDSYIKFSYIFFRNMHVSSNIAFKEWAVVVDALARGDQSLILRKGGIREIRGAFQLEHREFWLFPTQYHEAEQSIIPSVRNRLAEITPLMRPDVTSVQYFTTVSKVFHLTDLSILKRLQGRHIWTEQILQQRFEFGRELGLHALVTRIYRRSAPNEIPIKADYGGCKSWITLDQPIEGEVQPVIADHEFLGQQEELCELMESHACAYS